MDRWHQAEGRMRAERGTGDSRAWQRKGRCDARPGSAFLAAFAIGACPLLVSPASAGEYTLYAKAVSTADWTNPNGVLGTPLCGGPCPCSNGDYASIAADNNDPLIATDFDPLTLTASEVVLDVRVNALGRFETNQAGTVRLIVGGLTPTNQTIDLAVPAQAGTDCNYFVLPDGWSVYSLASPAEWPAKINANLTLGVRSIGGSPANTLACKALRIRVITGLANDECSGAINIPEGLIPFSTLNATDSADSVDPDCADAFSNDIWYRYVAPCTGVTTLSTCDLVDFNAVIAVYAACASPHPIECDDDTCDDRNGGATLTFDTVAGEDYFIRLGGIDGASGSGFLGIFCQPAPSNDECAGAVTLPDGLIPISTLGATDSSDPVDPECADSFDRDVWYRYVAPCSGVTTLSTCDLVDFDAVLAVYPACGAPHPIACDDFSCDDPIGGATLSFDAAAGEDYYIRLGGVDGASGSGFLGIFCQPGPSNDECAGAITLPDGLIPISTLGATNSSDPVDPDCADAISRDVWYRYVAPCTGVTTLSTCDLVDFDAVLAVYPSCGAPHAIACDAFSCTGVYGGATLTFDAAAGEDYYIRLGGLDGASGTGFLGIFCQPGPSNDECAGAITLPDGLIPISTLGATNSSDPVDPDCADTISRDVWYRYVAPCTGVTTLSTCDLVDFDAVLAVYPACGAPHAIACDAFSCDGVNGGATLTFVAAAGEDYFIRLGGLEGASGTGFLGIFCAPGVSNDECADAILVANGSTAFSTVGATTSQVPFPMACTDSFTNDLWYRYIAPCTGTAMLSTCGTVDFDSVLAVYKACASSIAIACNDQGCGDGENSSMLSFPVVAGEDYLIRVGGAADDAGSGSFSITCATSTTPPSNDSCAAAKVLAIGSGAFTTIGATAGGPALPACVTVGTKDVWYRHVATCTGLLTVTACGSAPVQAVIYSGGCVAPTLLGCGEPACGSGSIVTSSVTAGSTYLVRLVDQGGGTTGTITVACTVPINPDLDGDGIVGASDLSILLGAWGAGGPADFDHDGHVDADDLATLLGAWGI